MPNSAAGADVEQIPALSGRFWAYFGPLPQSRSGPAFSDPPPEGCSEERLAGVAQVWCDARVGPTGGLARRAHHSVHARPFQQPVFNFHDASGNLRRITVLSVSACCFTAQGLT